MARCFRPPYDTSTVTTQLMLVQLLVLGATGVLFWLARRDLRSRPPAVPPVQPDTRELEQLCVTLESLVTEMSRRLDRLERQTAQAAPAASSDGDRVRVGLAPPAAPSAAGPGSSSATAADARYEAIYALLDAGVSDPQEITRRAGLSRGEVDLILSLRDRRAL